MRKIFSIFEECPICLNEFKGLVLITGCNHVYCYNCLKRWRVKNLSCPLCRKICYKTIYQCTSPISESDINDVLLSPTIKPGLTRKDEFIYVKEMVRKHSRFRLIYKEIVARYFYLIPSHYADNQLLIDIESVLSNSSNKVSNFYYWLINAKTYKEEDEIRRRQLIINLTEKEKTILREYYLRHNLDPDEEFDIRKEFVKSQDFVYAPRSRHQ
ncbi:uncharacterized protein LOC126898464 isoform X2 [Daktulosphaira vitifoliae]|uniref:uncharacterized protein LOC126898464 isoform X2 n=1 Tax=Daktulosphaira vitifoliae TaxID=58002 RepID=UPI0021AA2BD5|nr:uncharacterized protein LOC126898464 isoform X2 [Daktulosphaira vitifoliae]